MHQTVVVWRKATLQCACVFQCALSAALLSPGIAVYMKPGPNAAVLFCAAGVAVDVEGTVVVTFVVSIPFENMLLMFC